MRLGTCVLLGAFVAAGLLGGCATSSNPDDGIARVIGRLDGNPKLRRDRVFPDTWQGWVDVETEYAFEADIDDNGLDNDVTTWSNRFLVRFDGPTGWRGGWLVSQASFEHADYDWSDDPAPFGDARYASLDLWLLQGLAEDWAVGILPRVSSSTEVGADFDDGIGWMVGIGAIHEFSDEFALGFGALVIRSFDEEWFVYPAIQGYWDFSEDWTLRVLGTALEVRYDQSDKLTWRGGIEIDSGRFLLHEEGTVALLDYRLPLYVGLEYGVAERFGVDARLGFDVYRQITYDDEGHDEEDFDVDLGAFFSLGFTWYF